MPSVLEGSVFPIQLERVSVERDGREILAPCDLIIGEGEKIAIIGESGSGKTTLLNLIYGEIKPSQGRIRYHGQELSSGELYQAGAYILQSSHVFDGLSLEGNIALGQELDSVRMGDSAANRIESSPRQNTQQPNPVRWRETAARNCPRALSQSPIYPG